MNDLLTFTDNDGDEVIIAVALPDGRTVFPTTQIAKALGQRSQDVVRRAKGLIGRRLREGDLAIIKEEGEVRISAHLGRNANPAGTMVLTRVEAVLTLVASTNTGAADRLHRWLQEEVWPVLGGQETGFSRAIARSMPQPQLNEQRAHDLEMKRLEVRQAELTANVRLAEIESGLMHAEARIELEALNVARACVEQGRSIPWSHIHGKRKPKQPKFDPEYSLTLKEAAKFLNVKTPDTVRRRLKKHDLWERAHQAIYVEVETPEGVRREKRVRINPSVLAELVEVMG